MEKKTKIMWAYVLVWEEVSTRYFDNITIVLTHIVSRSLRQDMLK